MKTALLRAIALLILSTLYPLPAQEPKPPKADKPLITPSDELVSKREAAFAAAKEAARKAYATAAAVRDQHDIIDPDPEGSGVTLSPKDDPNVIEYLRLKEAYFKAKAEIAIAEDAWYAARPMDVLQAEAASAEKEMTEAFAKVAEFLQSGKIADPNPDNPNSGVSLVSNDKEVATTYLERKSNYLALKNRSMKAQKALAAAKARKTPAADVTK